MKCYHFNLRFFSFKVKYANIFKYALRCYPALFKRIIGAHSVIELLDKAVVEHSYILAAKIRCNLLSEMAAYLGHGAFYIYSRDFMNNPTSSKVGITDSAPLLVVMIDAAAFANDRHSDRPASERSLRPFLRI